MPTGYKTTLKTILNNQQSQILDGLLLGDGCLYKQRINDIPHFMLGSITKNFINNIQYNLPLQYGPIKIRPHKQYIRNNKLSIEQTAYYLVSHNDITLIDLYNKWYPYGKKIIPKDLTLTPLSVKYWFYGDGSTSYHSNEHKNLVRVTLCTNSFILQDVEYLLTKLNNIGLHFNIYKSSAKITKDNKKRGYYLYTSKMLYVQDFFNYIQECNICDFQYKWKIPYKIHNGIYHI